MGLLDDITAFFSGDLFYPDNPKRAARLQELELDCNGFLSDCRDTVEQINHQLKALRDFLDPREWNDDIPQFLSPAFTTRLERQAYQLSRELLSPAPDAQQLSLLLTTPILPDGRDWVFGLPKDFFCFGPQRGAERRARLRDGIQAVCSARRNILYLRNFYRKFLGLATASVVALKALADAHIPANAHPILQRLSEQACRISDHEESDMASADQWLITYDKTRASWTDEG